MSQLLIYRRMPLLPRLCRGRVLSCVGVLLVEMVHEEGGRVQDRLVSSVILL